MTFIESFEQELARQLVTGECTAEDIVRWASERVLESYRNGITAGKQGATVKRQGESRRRGIAIPQLAENHGQLVRRGLAEKRKREESQQA